MCTNLDQYLLLQKIIHVALMPLLEDSRTKVGVITLFLTWKGSSWISGHFVEETIVSCILEALIVIARRPDDCRRQDNPSTCIHSTPWFNDIYFFCRSEISFFSPCLSINSALLCESLSPHCNDEVILFELKTVIVEVSWCYYPAIGSVKHICQPSVPCVTLYFGLTQPLPLA